MVGGAGIEPSIQTVMSGPLLPLSYPPLGAKEGIEPST